MAIDLERFGDSSLPAIRGLAALVIGRELQVDGEAELPLVDETARELLGKVVGMQPHLAFGMLALTRAFELSGVALGGKASSLSVDRRAKLLSLWTKAPLGPARDFATFYEKMGAFVFNSLVEEQGDE